MLRKAKLPVACDFYYLESDLIFLIKINFDEKILIVI